MRLSEHRVQFVVLAQVFWPRTPVRGRRPRISRSSARRRRRRQSSSSWRANRRVAASVSHLVSRVCLLLVVVVTLELSRARVERVSRRVPRDERDVARHQGARRARDGRRFRARAARRPRARTRGWRRRSRTRATRRRARGAETSRARLRARGGGRTVGARERRGRVGTKRRRRRCTRVVRDYHKTIVF